MLGDKGLDAARFPKVLIHSVSVSGELPRLVTTVAVTVHGVSQELLVPLEAQLAGDELRVRGAFALRQTDFGVTPYSVLGGALAVQDEVAIEFDLRGRPATFY